MLVESSSKVVVRNNRISVHIYLKSDYAPFNRDEVRQLLQPEVDADEYVINGDRYWIENGELKKEEHLDGYLSVEEAFLRTIASVRLIYKINRDKK